MKSRKINLSRLLILLATSAVVITIISLTIGRELYEGRTQSITSFALIHFSGYLFFLFMPVEMAFVYYLSFYPGWQLIGTALVTAGIAQLIDYLIGLWVSAGFIQYIVGEKRIQKAEKHIRKYGNLTIFFFNFLPLSSPVIALVAGMLRYNYKNYFLYSLIGLIIKYLMLSLIF